MSEHADVLIVGAGASGGVAALRLARPASVVCLEQGDWPDPDDYPGAGPDWELGEEAVVAVAERARPPGRLPARPRRLRPGARQLQRRRRRHDAVQRALAAPAAGRLPGPHRSTAWPTTGRCRTPTVPYYDETDRQFGVSGLGGNPAYPPGADPPLPPLPIGARRAALARAHARARVALVARVQRHPRRPRATVATRACNGGRAVRGATRGPRHRPTSPTGRGPWRPARGCVTGARVRRIDRRPRSRPRREWVDADGREHFQAADVVLCAANGIGTARLLLLSAHAGAPDGLANSSGLVGRRLMLHPGRDGRRLLRRRPPQLAGPLRRADPVARVRRHRPRPRVHRGHPWSLTPTGGPLAAAFGLRGRAALGADHHRHHARRVRPGRAVGRAVRGPPRPREPGRALGHAGGRRRHPRTQGHLPHQRQRPPGHRVGIERATESLTEAGAHTVDGVACATTATCSAPRAWATTATSSVVDRWGIAHDVRNLAIVDGSVFVTVGAANPTSTISALALRAVDHLLAHRADVPVPEPARHFALRAGTRPAGAAASAPVSAAARGRRRGARPRPRAGSLPRPGRRPHARRRRRRGGGRPARPRARRPPRSRRPPAPRLDRDVDDPGARLEVLRTTDAPAYHAWSSWCWPPTTGRPTSGRASGYPGQEATPVGRFEFPEYLSEGLLDHLVAR